MSLVVSLVVPDGIILAADSMASAKTSLVPQIEGNLICKNCGEKIPPPKIIIPPVPAKSGSLTAQKIFKFKTRFGVGFWGDAFINGQTICQQINWLECQCNNNVSSVDEATEIIAGHFSNEVRKQLGELAQIPKNNPPLGFMVVGYQSAEASVGRIYYVTIGQETHKQCWDGPQCRAGGAGEVAMRLVKKDQEYPLGKPNYTTFTLQDAIDYADFIIRTTSDFQRFATMIPTVGGEADIALITTRTGFKWIRCKPLTKIIEES